MKKLSVYGKGGIGKSATTSDLYAVLAKKGHKIIQIGCDPKSDSTKNLMNGNFIQTILDKIGEDENKNINLDEIIFNGFAGVYCVEAGGPVPGVGCAGRGIISSFEKLEKYNMPLKS